ncbi:hypothetical protein EJ03DRAFT_372759 [Teratosphaeria nubilosa]|uniref:BTB domain-containing protein n=1 Tax=Teratosphaeria nubilosa TaxID=161662 RepID=A0A6G1LFM8_9PEZI|nr:hypothetical protein EJ03DRAFT_372759 [Teratosphaeria nubilosa]
MAENKKSCRDFAESLKSDSVIKIFVGEEIGQKPYLVARSILEGTAESFQKALQHAQNFGSGELDVLRFPKDDKVAWEVLLYWMLRGTLPAPGSLETEYRDHHGTDCYDGHLVRCWCLGDKYGIYAFQNEIMVQLILLVECNDLASSVLRDALENTAPGSKLRNICMEDLVVGLNEGSLEPEELDLFDGVVGFISAFRTAMLHSLRVQREMRREPGCMEDVYGW